MPTCLRHLLTFRFLRRLLAGVVLLYAGVSLTWGGRPEAKTLFHALAGGWVLALGIFSTQAGERGRLSRWVEVVAVNLALTLVLAELALRAFAALAGTSLVLSDTLDAYRLVSGRDYGGGLRGNRQGYPGPDFRRAKRPGVFRIAALGDSFAVGPTVPFADNYLTLLEKSLPGVEVYNFGVSGTGPREYLAILQRDVWAYQPDLVLVSVFVGNDITETLATPRHMDLRQHCLYLFLTRGWRLLHQQPQATAGAGAGEARLRAAGLPPAVFREVEGRRLAVCRRPVLAGMEKKWRHALDYLDRLAAACRSRNVPLAVVLIPDEFQVNPEVLKDALAEAGAAREEIDLQLPQRCLARFFTERGVPCLDLLPAFARSRDNYTPRDTHWNVRGNRLAASIIARWLANALEIPSGKS